MQRRIDQYLQKIRQNKQLQHSFWSIAVCLSLVVVIGVFWYLKLTGVTLAGEAFCGMDEHTHIESCYDTVDTEALICERIEHIHIESCYSDITADLETQDDWEMSFAQAERGSTTAENLVILAKTQLGYKESELNFEVGEDGIRRGITRYGQWYGNPYGDWSSMFVMFCMTYAGVEDVPTNAGPESLRLSWDEAGLYATSDEYSPMIGDIIFISDPPAEDGEGSAAVAARVAIIVSIDDNIITMIEGDVDGAVAEVTTAADNSSIMGYGIIPEYSEYAATFAVPSGAKSIASTVAYNSSFLTSSNRFVLYIENGGNYYAIDGTGAAVQVYLEDGKISTDVDNLETLLWTFSRYNNNSSAIQNVGTGRHLHPYYNSASDNGITTPGRWGTTVSSSGQGAKMSHSAYIGFDSSSKTFYMTRTQNQNVTFNFGISRACTVWLDGTNGGIMSLGGSDNISYSVFSDSTMTLPESWKSPDKYEYVLKGWYDIVNHKYYAPGEEVVITGNTVFYADWKAASYDIGEFNTQTTETVSTNSFITTRMFDYGALMNLLSENVNVTVDGSGHSETWNLITSGKNPYNGENTFNFILRDWDRGNEDISYPNNHNDVNNPTDAGTVYSGLYTDAIRDAFFDPNVILPGKEYLGEADHLFQLCLDQDHEHFGYYYYNSERNAASYNQTDQRFYVYEYLEATRDSINNEDAGKYSDFLPLNSPYNNTNGKSPVNYTYDGTEGEYVGTTHYMYDSRYNDNNNTTNNIGTNFWFGMSVEVSFYLPIAPGSKTAGGEYGNKDIYGADMHFRFTGDDDVWIFVDDTLVLDLGGLHGRETGDINFSTGVVTINGVKNDALSAALQRVSGGEHTLTMYYMERGSSMSNCAIYFNLAPRFSFSIEKEDVLTKDVLNGAQFSVYTDRECTIPAELWTSKESHDNKDPATNTFTVRNGVAKMWGMGAGNVYYIKETKPPDDPDYGIPNGIICVSFDQLGTASYNVEMLDDGSGISGGFVVHGFRLDAETQNAYIIATNAPKWVKETTSVEVMKYWDDALDHSSDEVIVYLTVTDADGTVRRLQEAVVSAATDWMAKWENLPKYAEDGKTLIQYGVEESYVSGYYSHVEEVEDGHFEIRRTQWRNADRFEDGKVYLLCNSSGQALSTQRYAEDTGYMWVDSESAKTSNLARWRASVKGSNVRLTNLAGQTITFYYGNGSPTDFYAFNQHVEDNNRKQYYTVGQSGGGITLRYNNYYLYSSWNSSQKFQTGTRSSNALVLNLMTEVIDNVDITFENEGFLVTNTPIEKETSVTVNKEWVIPPDMDSGAYEREQVTVRLFANGADTGRTLTLNLKNSWSGVFKGLPYEDADKNPIIYTVKEVQVRDQWIVSYSDVTATGTSPPNYAVTVINTYRIGGPVLPSTGSPARLVYMLCGSAMMLSSLVCIIAVKRKRGRRTE